LCMTDVEGSVEEAHRAVKELGAGGVQMFTNIAGRPLDDPTYNSIFATMTEFDLPIWLRAHLRYVGLRLRTEVALRDVVVLRLAL
jgi:predicted TIM-barrel fold metal-dependent hydrolase